MNGGIQFASDVSMHSRPTNQTSLGSKANLKLYVNVSMTT